MVVQEISKKDPQKKLENSRENKKEKIMRDTSIFQGWKELGENLNNSPTIRLYKNAHSYDIYVKNENEDSFVFSGIMKIKRKNETNKSLYERALDETKIVLTFT